MRRARRAAAALAGRRRALGAWLACAAAAAALAAPSVASASATPFTGSFAPGDHTLTLAVQGLERTLIVHVPPGRVVASRPLLLIFHGRGNTARSTEQGTDFKAVADATGEVVAYLQGVNNAWNDQAHPHVDPVQPNDVAFASAAITAVERHVVFDHARVVAVGFSNGALMVEDLGCRLAARLAMIVPVEGELAQRQSAHCAPAKAISVYEVHGTADTAIPYAGGQFGGSDGPVELSAPKSAARWAALDRCAATPRHTAPSASIRLATYHGCRHSVVVTLRTIVGGVHQWEPDIGRVVHAALPPA